MEKKIIEIFDDISPEEAEELLYKDIDIRLDQLVTERIKNLTLKKAGFYTREHKHLPEDNAGSFLPRKTRRLSRPLVASAAAVIIAVAAFLSVGSDSALAAIQKLFHFIPGYGIVEDDGKGTSDQIIYILDEPVLAENDIFSLSLQNAVATKHTITIIVEMTDKEIVQAIEGKSKQMIEDQLTKSGGGMAKVQLQAADIIYDRPMGSSASSGDGRSWHTWSFDLGTDETRAGEMYTLLCSDKGVSLSFYLKEYDTFSSLEEIGATDVHNDISITAIAKEEDGKLHVELYPINHQYDSSRPESLSIYSFMKDSEYGYQGDDLHLQTNTGKKSYEKVDSHMGPNTKFTFNLDATDEELFLKIPYIVVQSREEQIVKLKVPKSAEKIILNQRVEFEGCTLIIKSIEREEWPESSNECLKMEYAYENHMPGKILMNAAVIEVGALDRWIGGGGSWETDENGITARYWFMGEEGYGSTIRLKFQNPVYYLTDAYTLKLTLKD